MVTNTLFNFTFTFTFTGTIHRNIPLHQGTLAVLSSSASGRPSHLQQSTEIRKSSSCNQSNNSQHNSSHILHDYHIFHLVIVSEAHHAFCAQASINTSGINLFGFGQCLHNQAINRAVTYFLSLAYTKSS